MKPRSQPNLPDNQNFDDQRTHAVARAVIAFCMLLAGLSTVKAVLAYRHHLDWLVIEDGVAAVAVSLAGIATKVNLRRRRITDLKAMADKGTGA